MAKHLAQLYAFVENTTKGEMLLVGVVEDKAVPFIAVDPDKLNLMKRLIKQREEFRGRSVKLVRYNDREDLEEII